MAHTIIKNQIKVEDPRLGRVEQFDQRSRNFPILAKSEDRPLRSYTWRCREHFDQGVEGACVAYALGHELNARAAEVQGITDNFLRERVYWEAQRNDPWPGGSYPGASPFYEGTSVLAGIKAIQKLGLFEGYRWAFSTQEALLGIGYHGPAVIGVPWFSGMFNPDSEGYIHPTGFVAGGHAVLVRGVNVRKERVTIRNSWGQGWGINGDCYMSFSDFDKVLQMNGECAFLLNRKRANLHTLGLS